MRRDRPRDLAASVRQRLANLADRRGEDFQLVLTHYALERLLYRLDRSAHRDAFILKGAKRLASEIGSRGSLAVLRKGIKTDGCKFQLAYVRPASGLNAEVQKL